MPRLPHRSLILAACLATAVSLAACSSDSGDRTTADDTLVTTTAPEEETTTTDPPTTTTEPLTPEQEVEAAYLRAAAVLDRAFLTSNPEDEGLAATRVDPSLSNIRELLTRRRAAGEVLNYPGGVPPLKEVLSVELESPEKATAIACVIDNAVLVSSEDGREIDNLVVARLTTNAMRHVDGAWKVESVKELKSIPDGEACPTPESDA